MAHLNVRSLLLKVSELQCILFLCDIDVMCLSEMFLTGNISEECLLFPITVR